MTPDCHRGRAAAGPGAIMAGCRFTKSPTQDSTARRKATNVLARAIRPTASHGSDTSSESAPVGPCSISPPERASSPGCSSRSVRISSQPNRSRACAPSLRARAPRSRSSRARPNSWPSAPRASMPSRSRRRFIGSTRRWRWPKPRACSDRVAGSVWCGTPAIGRSPTSTRCGRSWTESRSRHRGASTKSGVRLRSQRRRTSVRSTKRRSTTRRS